MLHKTQAIVLKTIKYGETSVITKMYTEKFGVQTYIINGVRSAKSNKKASLVQPPTLLDLVVYHKENRDLQRLSEIKNACVFQSIPFDVVKSALAMFMVEVLNQSLFEEEANMEQFDFLYHAIEFLDKTTTPVGNIHLYFMTQFSKHLGFYPHGSYSEQQPVLDLLGGRFLAEPPRHSYYIQDIYAAKISELQKASWENYGQVKLQKEQRKIIVENLIDFYKLHLEQFHGIKSLPILEEILS